MIIRRPSSTVEARLNVTELFVIRLAVLLDHLHLRDGHLPLDVLWLLLAGARARETSATF